MRPTGIIRRIDDLGRVVIPKEIRRNMMIADGDALEIFVDDGAVCFKKYSVTHDVASQLTEMAAALTNTYFVNDADRQIAEKLKEYAKEINELKKKEAVYE